MMDLATRAFVRLRADERCEYCGISQVHIASRLQIEHVIARQHGGIEDPSNLALACDRCNAYKGPNLSAIDPHTGNIVSLFHPRKDRWHDHFHIRDALVIGRSETGRATIKLLNMNAPRRVLLRAVLGAEAIPP